MSALTHRRSRRPSALPGADDPAALWFTWTLSALASAILLLVGVADAAAQTSTEEARPAPPGLNTGPSNFRSSPCYAFSQAPFGPQALPVRRASFFNGLEEDQLGLTFVGHATFLLETASGVTIATDFAGWAGPGVTPTAVTMNGAHSTHFTNNPDPAIETVLRGWREDSAPANHDVTVGELRIRSVSTDTSSWSGGRNPNGNSIFVFELGDLCVGHLGHLHHVPTPEQFAQIGFLDVVLAPVDGGYTMPLPEMIETLERLRARVVIPMHWFGGASLQRFLGEMADRFPIVRQDDASLVLHKRSLPREMTIVVLPEMRPSRVFIDD